jgi:hypothetical protein
MSIFQAWFTTESIRFRVRALKALRDLRTEFVAIWRHLRPGDIACDIGANKGSFIYWLSWWVGDGRVVAFEPQFELARYLQRLCRIIGLGNVTVEAKAVYSHSGDRDLFVPEGHGPGASLQHKRQRAEILPLSRCRWSRSTIISGRATGSRCSRSTWRAPSSLSSRAPSGSCGSTRRC